MSGGHLTKSPFLSVIDRQVGYHPNDKIGALVRKGGM
jgi:hypothetical protein